MGILATMKEKLNAKKSKRDNDELKLINIYLYIDRYNYKIIAHTVPYANTEYIPFTITPQPKSSDERYAYRMYPSNNLYRIMTNGGIELNKSQKAILKQACKEYIGTSKYEKIENEEIATITRKELHELIDKLAYTISRQQCDLIEKNKEIDATPAIH